jgi:hypothetical protein
MTSFSLVVTAYQAKSREFACKFMTRAYPIWRFWCYQGGQAIPGTPEGEKCKFSQSFDEYPPQRGWFMQAGMATINRVWVVPNGSCGQGDSPQSSINGTHSKL